MPIVNLSFLAPGNYAHDDPYTGLEGTLSLFELGEQLGVLHAAAELVGDIDDAPIDR